MAKLVIKPNTFYLARVTKVGAYHCMMGRAAGQFCKVESFQSGTTHFYLYSKNKLTASIVRPSAFTIIRELPNA